MQAAQKRVRHRKMQPYGVKKKHTRCLARTVADSAANLVDSVSVMCFSWILLPISRLRQVHTPHTCALTLTHAALALAPARTGTQLKWHTAVAFLGTYATDDNRLHVSPAMFFKLENTASNTQAKPHHQSPITTHCNA